MASATTKETPKVITSFGPAGSKLSVREAGENILNNFCHGYPDTDVSSMIPPFFSGNITELMDPRPNITRKEEEKRRGRELNQEGEHHENTVFNLFVQLIRQSDISSTLLIMRTFELDTKNGVGLKRLALMSELPGLNLESAITTAENDFVVLVKDCGVVFIEVKGSTKDNNVRSAEKQLKNVNSIVQSVMKAITGDKQRTLPTVKLIVVPDCKNPSPKEKTRQGSLFLFKDSCENFEQKMMEVIDELRKLKSLNPFSTEEFKELSHILVGIWSANAICGFDERGRKYHLEQVETDVSYVEQLREIDAVVDTSDVRNESHFKLQEDKLNPWTNIVRTTEQDIFRSCSNIKLCYLTPLQKEVFTFNKHALIHGVAGSGKSLLLLFKVLELVHTSKFHILIMSPPPHTIRICNFLRSNNVSFNMIEEFPPCSPSNVFVMDINKFFKVKQSTLMNYNLSNYHLFFDDMQHMELSKRNYYGDVTFHDVGDFIELTYKTCEQYDTYCWFMTDVCQGGGSFNTGTFSDSLFITHDNKPRSYSIPIIQLSHVMRNTHEVIQLTNQVRERYVNRYTTKLPASHPTPQSGHKVTSRVPITHLLQLSTDKKYKVPFIIERLREELKSVTNPPHHLQLSDVAIIWDETEYFDEHKETIALFLTTEFGTNFQTIEEQLTSNNRADIILDVVENIMSFEAPIVVCICSWAGRGDIYNICTRARVALTVIDVSDSKYFNNTNNSMDTVIWKPDNNTFIKFEWFRS